MMDILTPSETFVKGGRSVTRRSIPKPSKKMATLKKKRRHRKKQLYGSILKQMEFYFSDAALSKDRFLAQQLEKDPFVPLDVFLRFNKMKALTSKVSEIAGALQDSKLLELSPDNLKVKRVLPMTAYDADARTIYVESIPVTADLQWLTNVFQAHGQVAYISLPKYFNSNRIKGFAFVEFNKEEDAKQCMENFVSMGCKLPTNIKAETLASCQGFQPDVTDPAPKSDAGLNRDAEAEYKEKDIKEDNDQNEDEENNGDKEDIGEPPAKKKKVVEKKNSDEEQKDDKIASVEGDKENVEENKDERTQESGTEMSESAAETEDATPAEGAPVKKGKPVRKRKTKDRKKAHKVHERKSLALTARSLQVLSKCEWKVLRNKYLQMQRKHMKALKQVLRTQHTLPANRDRQSTPMAAGGSSEQVTESEGAKSLPAIPPEIPFVPGVVVAVRLAEPCVDVKGLRRATKENVHVSFVDVKEGQMDVHVRMDNAAAAKLYAASGIFPLARVLSGQEEHDYWEVLKKQQHDKFSSKRKVRGRDRLVKKAQQFVDSRGCNGNVGNTSGKHIRFDE